MNEALRQRPNDENKICLIFDESEEFKPTGKYLDAYNEAIEEWNKVMKPQFEVVSRERLNEIIREQGPQTVNILRQDRETSGWGYANGYAAHNQSGRYFDEIYVVLNEKMIEPWWKVEYVFPWNSMAAKRKPIAAHELGHVLGLSHSYNYSTAYNESGISVPHLHPDDIAGIEALYGRKP